jgi:Phage terminase large subunit (GpA)
MFAYRPDSTDVETPDGEESEVPEFTDEELARMHDGQPWAPEPEPFIDFMEIEAKRAALKKIPSVLPSQFTEFAFRMPRQDGLGYEGFSFEGRRHMVRPYNTPAKRILLFCGRQVEKSTLLGNIILTYSCIVPAYKTLYVSPSATQTKVFSSDRIKEPIETSEVLRAYTTTMLSMNIFEKQFVNRAKITLRYAFLNADRTRGIPAWCLAMDELQDILSDNIPVIEQCTSHAPERFKRFIYAGTPKGLDNSIEYYRSGVSKDGRPMSTQGEWVVPCDACGSKEGAGRYWNVLGEKNMGRTGLICEKCGKPINPAHPDSQWATMVQDGIFESYRIPQLMVPWRSWDEIMLDYSRYPRDKFYNEVLGISYDSGMRPLTLGQIKDCCNPNVTMHPEVLESNRKKMLNQQIFAGLDHGTGENSYTVACLGTYEGDKFRIFWIHRFVGEDTDPQIQVKKLTAIFRAFNVRIIGSDYGGGFATNNVLLREFGQARVQRFQYAGRAKKKVFQNPQLQRWIVHRTEVMSDMFAAIKRKLIEFPRFEEFREPFAQDMLNIYSEYNNTLRMIQYDHRPDRPDDSFHAILYCFLASMIMIPRPDIIVPKREFENQGPTLTNYKGTLYQG